MNHFLHGNCPLQSIIVLTSLNLINIQNPQSEFSLQFTVAHCVL